MKRPVARKRQLDAVKRIKKLKFMKFAWHISEELTGNPVFVGRLTKGKIHCSCPACAAKTNSKNPAITRGWKHSDLQKIQKLSDDLIEEYSEAYQELAGSAARESLWDVKD